MRPRTLRELTELARDEMSPNEEERGRVYDSLCVAVAAGAAGTALAASTASAAVSTTAASTATTATTATTAAASTAAASGAAVQGGALAVGAAQAGGALASSGLLLKGLVLLVAVGSGAGLLSVGDEGVITEHAQGVLTEEVVPLRRETGERIEAPTEAPLFAPVQELGVQEPTPPRASNSPRRRTQTRALPAVSTIVSAAEPHNADVEESAAMEVDAALTRAARRLQHAQRAMAQGDGASTLALLVDNLDPRLRAERLALRVLALCQVGDVRGAQREADELRTLDGPSSAALARISNSCVDP